MDSVEFLIVYHQVFTHFFVNFHRILPLYFQEAYTLTALDRRVFAPPIENKEWQRVVNMANTCETFHFAPTYVAHLFHRGFKSVTLLSMAENLSKKNPMAAQHNKCLSVLNDRRVTPLEPLHSLRRLLQAKRKQAFKLKHVDYLDLANVSPKKQKLPPNRDYRVRYFDTYYRSILENRPKFAETEF